MGVHFICSFCASETRVELMTIINLNFQAISKSVAVEGISNNICVCDSNR